MDIEIYKTYPHNPPHLFRSNAYYIVTASTIDKNRYLNTDQKKQFLCDTLFEQANRLDWKLEAWSVFSNHYHIVIQAPENALTLEALVRAIHSITSRYYNRLDGTPGRKIWFNYWDSCITYEKSFLARLCYVHMNPVKHGLVEKAEDYPFCSYGWFLEYADPGLQERVLSCQIDHVQVKDDF